MKKKVQQLKPKCHKELMFKRFPMWYYAEHLLVIPLKLTALIAIKPNQILHHLFELLMS
jgi:hypothetical protein